jgi:hypothetical protein
LSRLALDSFSLSMAVDALPGGQLIAWAPKESLEQLLYKERQGRMEAGPVKR